MKPEKINLIHDLLEDGVSTRREATLFAGSRILRKRRARRATTRLLLATAVVAVVTTISVKTMRPPPRLITTSVPALPAQQSSLTDEELLALFPDTPVGLLTLQNGKKLLVFPRPGDEARFVTRL